MGAADSLTSDEALARRVDRVCREKLGILPTEKLLTPSFGSEDYSYMMNAVQKQGGQALFFRALTECYAGSHNRRFDFEESFLENGVKLFCTAVYDLMK